MLGDAQPAAVLEQPVQHVRRLGRGRRDDLGVEGAELVGDVGVERDARLVAVAGVDVAERLARPPARKNCPSELEVVPSPQAPASGSARCASISRASAAA